MTEGELATIAGSIIGGLGTIGTILKWGLTRITKVVERNSEALLKFVESAARLETKLDAAHAASIRTQDAVEAVADEVSGVHQAAQEWTANTPPKGTSTYMHLKKRGI